jgi:hypothetical protein
MTLLCLSAYAVVHGRGTVQIMAIWLPIVCLILVKFIYNLISYRWMNRCSVCCSVVNHHCVTVFDVPEIRCIKFFELRLNITLANVDHISE